MNLYKLHSEPAVLQGNDKQMQIPVIAYKHLRRWGARLTLSKGKRKKLEQIIAKSAEYSFKYARDIIRDRFELGEDVVSNDGEWGYFYAKQIIEGRWEEAEPAILTGDSKWIYFYAKHVIKGRWPEGETVLKQDLADENKSDKWANMYRKMFLEEQ